MKTSCLKIIWEDLVQDFLEIRSSLGDSQKEFLIKALHKRGITAEAIWIYPVFSIDGRIVIIQTDTSDRECWLYNPRKQTLDIQPILQSPRDKE